MAESQVVRSHAVQPFVPMEFKLLGGEFEGVPELVLEVNPESLDTRYEKLITTSITRGAFIEEHWGDRLDIISGNGTTLAFKARAGFDQGAGQRNQGDNVLLTIGAARRGTTAYRNFLELVDVFKNNGAIYGTDEVNFGQVVEWPGVRITFDDGIFDGYFQELNVTEVSDKPFRFEYNFVFIVKKTIIDLCLARQSRAGV